MLYNLLYPSAEQAEWMQSWLTVPSRAALLFCGFSVGVVVWRPFD